MAHHNFKSNPSYTCIIFKYCFCNLQTLFVHIKCCKIYARYIITHVETYKHIVLDLLKYKNFNDNYEL